MRIDSHQHFWKFDPVKSSWITEDMRILKRDFLPSDLKPLLLENNFDGCVAIQADQTEFETEFLLELSNENKFIKGVVGWIDLRAANVEERLEFYSSFQKLKGFRHILQAETDLDFMLGKKFLNGISMLKKYNFTYDILIFPKHLAYAEQLVARFPDQIFVIDHLAKPDFKHLDFEVWVKGITAIARHTNVFCKVSGLVTEADWKHWKYEDFVFCLEVLFDVFGIDRLLYGSDWPVSLLAAEYSVCMNIIEKYMSNHSDSDKRKVFGENAVRCYGLL